jgi:acyl-ACP thioesterase
MVPLPPQGRVFRAERRVRLADADGAGRLRLDACARYLQDIGNDDTLDAGADVDETSWVVRRAVVDVVRPPRWRERLSLATWCGGTGGRWAERRLSMVGEHGGSVEIATLWVHIDLTTMAPARLPAAFLDTYGEAALGRKVTSRRWLDGPDGNGDGANGDGAGGHGPVTVPWVLRATDIDLLGHVNNAAYWAAVEEQLLGGPAALRGAGDHPLRAGPYRAVMEYGAGLAPGAAVELRVADADDRLALWFTVGGAVDSSALVVPLPGG